MRAQRGFTLIELMIAVAIMAIIAGIAFTAFSGSGRDSRHARAIADLTALNDAMGRLYQTNFNYETATPDSTDASARAFAQLSGLSLTNDYNFAVVDLGTQAYALTAQPRAGGQQVGYGSMLIDQLGNRCFLPGNDTPPTPPLAVPPTAAQCPQRF